MISEQIIEVLSKIIDYINFAYQDSREKDNALTKLEETVFWITYLSDGD